MNQLHQELLDEIKSLAKGGTKYSWSDSYLSSKHIYYAISVPKCRVLIKAFVGHHTDLPFAEFKILLESLYKGVSYEEKTLAGYLLEYFPKLRKEIEPEDIEFWLGELQGWAEVDSTCQNKFKASDILGNWNSWKKVIVTLNKDKNINKRRASLVLLTGPVYQSQDIRLADLALENIDKLKIEQDILVTKAISWLLRSLIKNHKNLVEKYLMKNQDILPKIAVREVRRKLLTGRK